DSYPYCVDGCANQTYCGEVEVPAKHLETCRRISSKGDFEKIGESGKGVNNGHFILYVSAFESERCSFESTIAYAAYCRLDASFDRPVAGYVNMCPDEISLKMFDLHQMHFTIKHEILHALGFSSGLFAFYRDKNGQPLTPRNPATNKPPYNKKLNRYQWSDNVVRSVDRSDWLAAGGYINRTFNYIVTPSVLREVRQHFNCSSLEGAELENQGPAGTSFTHWEKRVFENELMTGTYTQNLVISRITLALLDDTGWYQVNYQMAGELKWGKNLGCDFAKSSCSQWILNKMNKNESIHPFCNHLKTNVIKTECTEDLSSVGVCNLIKHKHQLPPVYRNILNLTDNEMDMSHYGGSVPLADYCPYVQEFNWKENEKTVRGSKCFVDSNNPSLEMNLLLETYGKESICIEHSTQWTVEYCSSIHSVDNWGSGCYQYVCFQNNLGLILNNILHWCHNAKDVIRVTTSTSFWFHKGSLVCPDISKICKVSNNSNFFIVYLKVRTTHSAFAYTYD
ncbi:hypothetical protein HELRODRAFT_69677, partial [Helobdella robusta]|uniref:Leishmanolysin-like peptidase n=1 Tax=Helobdella robusta TaxID=6412 RepID=T1FZY0_HELRO